MWAHFVQTVRMSDLETAPSTDDETTAALTLFNEYVDADRERTRREKRVQKAERAKDDAAALVRKLNESGSAEQRASAEAAYRDAQEALKAIREGREPEPKAADEAPADEPAATDEAPADEAATDEAPAAEAAADEPAATDEEE
jgi:hypothetical protein